MCRIASATWLRWTAISKKCGDLMSENLWPTRLRATVWLSVSRLINSQPDSVCFHEINPSCMAWSSTPGPVISTLEEFTSILNGGQRSRITIDLTSPHRDEPLARLEKMSRFTNIGEIGFYYLEYIETIITAYIRTSDFLAYAVINRKRWVATYENYVQRLGQAYDIALD